MCNRHFKDINPNMKTENTTAGGGASDLLQRGVMRKADCHINCHDCGQFLKRELWVAKDHPWKKHGLCSHCADNYDYYPEY